MLRSLLSGAMRRGSAGPRPTTGGLGGGYGGTRGTRDPGAAVGAQVGRSLFRRLRAR